jgi:hypothetical protein
MSTHPYRTSARTLAPLPEVEPPDNGARGAAVLVSLASAARVGVAIREGEQLGFEPVLAASLCVLLPAALVKRWVARRRGA